MSFVPPYVVLRCADAGFKFDGWWFDDIAHITMAGNTGLDPAYAWKAVETDRFERRDSDGATARVWEVQRV